VWWVDFSPSIGREIRDEHPALVISADQLNQSPWGVLVVIPISERPPGGSLRVHVPVDPPEANLRKPSRVKCDQIGKADLRRFRAKLGEVSPSTLRKVEAVVRLILGL
jgi:mRNA-degrading endonuclease toxin of MazEF toxin-antitoxin module